MLAVIGTVPDESLPLISAEAMLSGNDIRIEGRRIPVNRGTPALLAAALATTAFYNGPPVRAFLVGDLGLGHGSRMLYDHLAREKWLTDINTLVFHYLQPDVDWHNRVLFAVEETRERPVLIADAGFMYAAKMSGQAKSYDLFTPDIGELAFLADEAAPHPFYTRGFILHEQQKAGDLIKRAYQHDNAAKYLLVKGQPDLLVNREGILAEVDGPVVESMEAIGGTGDTLTGIASALIAAGFDLKTAARKAARANRLAGTNGRTHAGFPNN